MVDVHVLLVSQQAAPNLLAALDPGLKPAEAVLLVSERMRGRADALERVLREAGVRTQRLPLANEHDYPALESALLELAAARGDERIALNVTGGTKLMALAAQSIALAAGWSVFYVDADTDEVIWLGARAGQRQRLTEHLRLRHYLMGYGFEPGASSGRPRPTPGRKPSSRRCCCRSAVWKSRSANSTGWPSRPRTGDPSAPRWMSASGTIPTLRRCCASSRTPAC